MSVMAFHEKAGRSQVGSFVFSLDKVFSLPPSRHCSPSFHPHFDERFFRSVQVGRSRYSRCCHLISDLQFRITNGTWARPLTQSPELGVLWLLSFLSLECFVFTLPAPSPSVGCCAAARTPLRSPKGDAATLPVFAPWR
jgi:hypothetical protein